MQRNDDNRDEGLDAFLARYDASAFPHPSLTVDVALATTLGEELAVLLLQRDVHPEQGRWALPGSFVGMQEALEDAAARTLRDKAGLEDVFLEQLYTFGALQRDPRTRVISVAYYALVDRERLSAAVRDSGGSAQLAQLVVPWEGEAGGAVQAHDDQGSELPLAFDHADVLGTLVQRLRGKLDYSDIGFELLPELFTLRQLQDVHETILGHELNKDSFRRRMLASGLLTPTGHREQDVVHRPAELYRFTGRTTD